jgi:hypothetical protein
MVEAGHQASGPRQPRRLTGTPASIPRFLPPEEWINIIPSNSPPGPGVGNAQGVCILLKNLEFRESDRAERVGNLAPTGIG